MTETPALALDGIRKNFGATRALDGATLHVRAGSVHALLGENGAGKTTLMRIAYGMLQPDAGTVTIAGQTAHLRSPADAIAHGIGMVHQHFLNVPAMTVAENVALGGHGPYDAGRASDRVRQVAGRVGLPLDPQSIVGDLPVSAQQRLEIVKALAHDARVLILDEPTAVLAPDEAEDLLRWLRGFANGRGTVVLITHRLREALAVADDVGVLRLGRTVLEVARGEVDEALLTRSMLGENLGAARADSCVQAGEVVIAAEGMDVRDDQGVLRISAADVEVRRGEILGVAAVEGSGHHLLLRALAGRIPVSGGRLRIPDVVGFVPEDRHRDALVLEFPLIENVALSDAASHRGIMRWTAWRTRTDRVLGDYDVRSPGADARASALSGGNQQKLVLGRELEAAASALVVENPTRGLDLRATAAVHDRLRGARAKGAAIVVHSSDLDEVLSLATRVIVVHAGRVHAVPLDRAVVGRAMLGVDLATRPG